MGNTFELERQRFVSNFANYKGKKIVLYGIGRRTATLVEQNENFNFVGLMDKDQTNIGKKMYNLPIISLEEAEKNADMIVINAPVTYWNVIYKRIQNSKIPVFYTNGKRAELKEEKYDINNPYWNKSLIKFENELAEYDVISFDMFDTLIARKVTKPEDIYEIIRNRIKTINIELPCDYITIRYKALNNIGNSYYSFDDLYREIQRITGIDEEIIEKIKKIELEVEKNLIIPRKAIINCCQKMIKMGKEIYIISDMYFSSQVLQEILLQFGLKINKENIFVSCEKGCDKRQGGLWKLFSETIICGRRAIHIGDDLDADIHMPIKFGISTYYIMSVIQMLRSSSIKELYNTVTNLKESLLVGMLATKLFHDPFVLGTTKGKVHFSLQEVWGYCVWGPVIFTFVQWLVKQSQIYQFEKLFFFARDGYLIQKDFDYYCKLLNYKNCPVSEYLYISRRLVYIADIQDKKSFKEWVEFPYIGKFDDFLDNRFSIKSHWSEEHFDTEIQIPNDKEQVMIWLKSYEEEITNTIKKERMNYLQFLSTKCFDDNFAIVDIGYNGNTQRKLSHILNKKITGFYFYNDLSPQNECNGVGKMIPCFQNKKDLTADKVYLFKYPLLLESIFTAPYGMIIKVDEYGNKICTKKGKNQEYFKERIDINEGIQTFIRDVTVLFNKCGNITSFGEEIFVDNMFGILFENSDLEKEMAEKFYWDDKIVQERENGIFI